MIGSLLAMCLAAAPGAERSPAVYPEQSLPLLFDHAQHMAAGADCLTCHETVKISTRGDDRNLPGHPECEECHDLKAAAEGKPTDPKSECRTCHPGFDQTARAIPPPVLFPAPNLRFNHRVHYDRRIGCPACHQGTQRVSLATRDQLPGMGACLVCHDGRTAPAGCDTCHPSEPGGRLKQTFPSGVLRPAAGNPLGLDHGPRFEFTHGPRAAQDRATCLACHSQNDCEKCHDGTVKPLSIHPGDFITTHPLAVRGNVVGCESCHRLQSFCAACHERAGIGMDADPTLLARNLLVHRDPQAWAGTATVDPGHHGIAASRDLRQCISCHREESCLRCHAGDQISSRLATVNPHPAGFGRQCRALVARNDRPCLRCHTESALAGWGCR
ncbi:MAG TPA: cytochrome c3 family protein [Myxococcales bacterium]|nr:cytochrome c3 family protein [Myxococcales bacterium]